MRRSLRAEPLGGRWIVARLKTAGTCLSTPLPFKTLRCHLLARFLADFWVSVDAPDADWAVKLVDLAPNGVARGLAEGILRASDRDPVKYPALLNPGRRVHLTVDLGHTAATILPGHALRIEIAGSSFPMFDRNLHTGEGPTGARKQVALQTVYHDRNFASRLRLSVLKPGRIR